MYTLILDEYNSGLSFMRHANVPLCVVIQPDNFEQTLREREGGRYYLIGIGYDGTGYGSFGIGRLSEFP